MKTMLSLSILLLLMASCERKPDDTDSYLLARITGFDMNCSTCILDFPDDSLDVKSKIGASPGNHYVSVNLSRGNYQPGQMLKVKIRKPSDNELRSCISLYPSGIYKDIFITDFTDFNNFFLGDTVYLSCKDCINDSENRISLCMESVVNDSRCPEGVYCFWAGNATVSFRLHRYNTESISFELNTHSGFTCDITIDGYKFTLLNLTPHPVYNQVTKKEDYKAEILIEKI